eukprot:364716-Chlamydomonas_euryale.AAC.5
MDGAQSSNRLNVALLTRRDVQYQYSAVRCGAAEPSMPSACVKLLTRPWWMLHGTCFQLLY